MKIDNSVKSVGSPGSGVRTGATKSGSGARPAAPESDVALSPLSSKLQQIESSLANTPTMNVERVAEVRQAIANGSYKIDTGKIADGLIESVRQMLVAQKR